MTISAEDKSKLKKNIFQLIFGLILLSCSFVYLNNHQAEAKSIWSGFGTLFEKVSVKWEKMTKSNDSGELLQKKYALEKYVDGVLLSLDGKSCISSKDLSSIKEFSTELKTTNNDELKNNWESFVKKTYEIDHLVKEQCK